MRRVGLLALLSLATFAGTAAAQPAPARPGGPNQDNSQFDLRRNDTSVLDAETARTKANAGDCAGALSAFDSAIQKSPGDATLRRDRGLCHERLGDTYPALDDLRAYITMRPDAPDGDAIRQKVNALEAKTDNDNEILESNDRRKTTAATEDSLDVYQKEDATKRHKNEPFGAKPGEEEKSFEYYKRQEQLDDRAHRSSMRNGHGPVVGAWVMFPRLALLGNVGGIGWAAGGSVKYSFQKVWTGFFDFGWHGDGAFRNVTNEPLYQTFRSGPLLALGAEARIALDKRANNQLVVRLGAGYEREVESSTKAYLNIVDGRFALGFRHVFGEGFGMTFMADGGPALAVLEGGDTKTGGILAFAFGLDFGL